MTGGVRFDGERARDLARTYALPEIVDQRRRVREAAGARPGERVLDIGSGPGLLAGELALEVGPGGSVTGVDVSSDMLAIAAARDLGDQAAPVGYRIAEATDLPFDDASFDLVVCTQVYEYVAEIEVALGEANRVLAPGGRLVVLDTDWDSLVWRSRDRDLMLRVTAAWDEHLADPHLPRRLPGLLRGAGFGDVRTSTFALLTEGYRESYSAGLIGMVASFVSGRQGITDDEARAWAADVRGLGEDYFFSVNRYLFVASR